MTQKQEESQELNLSKSAVLDTLSVRINRDVADAYKYIDAHEIIGILELIKISIATQVMAKATDMEATA